MEAGKSTEAEPVDLDALQERLRAERAATQKPDGRGLRELKRRRQDNLSLKVTRETTLALNNIAKAEKSTYTEIVERLILDYDRKMRGSK